MPRNWGALSLARAGRTVPTNWAIHPRPAQYENAFFYLSDLWKQWAQGDTINSKIALVSGQELGTIAPALLPVFHWEWASLSGSVVGLQREPNQAPVLTASGTLLNADTSMLNRTTLTISGSLQRELDEREIRVLRPRFARLKP